MKSWSNDRKKICVLFAARDANMLQANTLSRPQSVVCCAPVWPIFSSIIAGELSGRPTVIRRLPSRLDTTKLLDLSGIQKNHTVSIKRGKVLKSE